jgi:cyclophilin family peptidyl-prolyl cis-trans isomerase
MKSKVLLLLISLLSLMSCGKKENQVILISTEYGNIKIKLYDDTPLHRDNFVKLTEKGFYDGLLFHQILKDVMIEGGDPSSRNVSQNRQIGVGQGIGYTIPAEINFPKNFNKFGAIGALREDDNVNPKKESSGSSFYLVTGRVYTNQELDEIEKDEKDRRINRILNVLVIKKKDSIQILQKINDLKQLVAFQRKLIDQANKEYKEKSEFIFTKEQRKIYTTVGGCPQMDNQYTVFGEVIEGFDVLKKISAAKIGFYYRPTQDIKMKIKLITK